MKFDNEIKQYLDDKGLEHEVHGGTYSSHIKVRDVRKKFYLEVLLPEFRNIGRRYGMVATGTTHFTGHIYVRFFKGIV